MAYQITVNHSLDQVKLPVTTPTPEEELSEERTSIKSMSRSELRYGMRGMITALRVFNEQQGY